MNVKNNKRRKETKLKIGEAFMSLLETKDIRKISVSDICKIANINRSTFYSNYLDVYDLADKLRDHLEADLGNIFNGSTMLDNTENSIRFFSHIKDNQLYYKCYFKLGYDSKFELIKYDVSQAEKDFDNKHIKYHVEFFRNGLNSVIRMWIDGGCIESPEDMAEIIRSEYSGRG